MLLLCCCHSLVPAVIDSNILLVADVAVVCCCHSLVPSDIDSDILLVVAAACCCLSPAAAGIDSNILLVTDVAACVAVSVADVLLPCVAASHLLLLLSIVKFSIVAHVAACVAVSVADVAAYVTVSVADVAAVCCCLSPAAADAQTVAGLVPGLDPQHPVVAHRHLLHLT